MFSPYYAWSGWRQPENHCAINVALYGQTKRWAMTERGQGALRRSERDFSLGRSALTWDGGALDIVVDETCAPIPRRIKGRVRLIPEGINTRTFELEREGRHLWRPIAPRARVEVELENPALRWSGAGYFDTNQGDEPLEAGFTHWWWSRARTRNGAHVFYEAERRRAEPLRLSLAFDRAGAAREVEAPALAALPHTLWRLPRQARGENARVLESLEDAPFYARARIGHRLDSEDVSSCHETLDLVRFANPIVRAMLPFRMPRALK